MASWYTTRRKVNPVEGGEGTASGKTNQRNWQALLAHFGSLDNALNVDLPAGLGDGTIGGWDLDQILADLAAVVQVFHRVSAGDTITIPGKQQMSVHGLLTIEAGGVISISPDGQLAVRP